MANKKQKRQKPTSEKKTAIKKKSESSSLTLAPAPFKREQLLQILQRTPKNHIYRRKGKAGMEFEYVTGVYVKKVLNYCFGWLWDFQIVDKAKEGDLVWVQGKLSIKDKTGKEMITKEQFGRADIKFMKGTKIPVDYGNDLKAAATDALKKCASELGIASDVYGRDEFKEIQKQDKGFQPPEEEVAGESPVEPPKAAEESPKVKQLKEMLKGKTDSEKIADLKRRTGIKLDNLNITEKHAGILIASLLNSETK